MRLIDFMRSKQIDDAEMARRVDDISESQIRKLKYGERKPSIETAIRISNATDGQVGLLDWDDPAANEPPASPEPEAA